MAKKKTNKPVTHATILALRKEIRQLRKDLQVLRNEVSGAKDSAHNAGQRASAALYVANYCR